MLDKLLSSAHDGPNWPLEKRCPLNLLLRLLKEGHGFMIFKARSGRRKAIASSEETIKDLSQIISTIREAVWLRDAKTRKIIYVNPAYENLFGQSCQYFRENP
jgi:PAS domain-containing protein